MTEDAPDTVANLPSVMALYNRFPDQFKSFNILAKSDTTSSWAGHDTARIKSGEGDVATDFTLAPCTDACQHGDDWPQGATRVCVRPDGMVEMILPLEEPGGSIREVQVYAVEPHVPSAIERIGWPDPSSICADCADYEFGVLYPGVVAANGERGEWEDVWLALQALQKDNQTSQLFHKTFAQLQQSAADCAACRVFLSTLPGPESFTSDESRPALLRARVKEEAGERVLWYLEVGFPALDPRHPHDQVTRFGMVEIMTPHSEYLLSSPLLTFWTSRALLFYHTIKSIESAHAEGKL